VRSLTGITAIDNSIVNSLYIRLYWRVCQARDTADSIADRRLGQVGGPCVGYDVENMANKSILNALRQGVSEIIT
jgi:hypothetical protein